MSAARNYYAEGPEALVVSLATRGDRDAFAELVCRRQSWVRNFMRRCSRDNALADDLSQQVFLQAWRKIRQVKEPEKFGGWLKRIAINEWMQYQRKNNPDWKKELDENMHASQSDSTALAMDLDAALAGLPPKMRLCVVLSYHERLSHGEISAMTGLKLGSVKTNINRGSARLRESLSAYGENA